MQKQRECNGREKAGTDKKKTKAARQTDGGQASLAASEIVKTQAEAAKFLKVSKRTVRRYQKAGMPKTAQGHYIKSMLLFYQKHEGTEPNEDRKREKKAEADYKTTKARLLELELAIKVGELVKKEDLQKERIARIQMVKRALLGLGRKVAPWAAKMRDPRKLAALINEQVREIIERFAK